MSEKKVNDGSNSQSDTGKKKSPTVVVAILAGAVIVLMGGVIIFLLRKPAPAPAEEAERELIPANTVVTEENVDAVIAELTEAEFTPVGSYEVSMATEWVFPDGSAPSPDAFIDNVVNNTNTVYCVVKLADTEEVVYESPYLEVGASLQDIKLDTVLEAGRYDAVATFNLVDADFRDMSYVSVGIVLIVEG